MWLDKESISLEKQGIDGEIKQKGNKKGNSCQDQARPPPVPRLPGPLLF